METELTQIKGFVIDFRHKEGSPTYFYTVKDGNNNVVDVSSYKKDTGCRKGDYVIFSYKQNGDFKNLVGEMVKQVGAKEVLEVEEEIIGGGTSSKYISKEEDIHLQVCLKIACEVLKMKDSIPTPEQVVKYARELMKEVWG